MRHLFTGFVIAAVCAILPSVAMAGNQEIAEKIAHNMRQSGQMSDYRIGSEISERNGMAGAAAFRARTRWTWPCG